MNIINDINSLISNNNLLLQDWLEDKNRLAEPPFYTSTDIRVCEKNCYCRYKYISAGFNNLSEDFINIASENVAEFFNKNESKIDKVLIIPELHTRNPFYWDNVLALQKS